jgi:hypothetical protein
MDVRAAGQGGWVRDQPQDEDKSVETVPLDLDEGEDVVIEQENVGEDNMRGGGEWPDPDTPPSDAAPGSLPDR